MGYRLTLKAWDRLNVINEKYHIECVEIDDMESLYDFFYKCGMIDLEKEDREYVDNLIEQMKRVGIY